MDRSQWQARLSAVSAGAAWGAESGLKVAVVGAGRMGRGITRSLLQAGYQVRLQDLDAARVWDVVRELDRHETRLRPVCDMADLIESDIVIEAIVEDFSAKKRWMEEVEPLLPAKTILATNSSSFPLRSFADGLRYPSRLCGMHFCHPVEDRLLVEVVRGEKTSSAAITQAEDFVHRLGKTPVIVSDGPGFVLNRLLSLYLIEALELLKEGVTVEELNAVALQLGMPLGPLRQLDSFGLETAVAVGRQLWTAFPQRWIASELLIAVCKLRRRQGLVGHGFLKAEVDPVPHRSDDQLDPAVAQIVAERIHHTCSLTTAAIARRLWLPLLVESTRILEDGLVARLADIDRILELGLGMKLSVLNLEQRAASAGIKRLQDWLLPFQSLGGRFVPGSEFGRWIGPVQVVCDIPATRRSAG